MVQSTIVKPEIGSDGLPVPNLDLLRHIVFLAEHSPEKVSQSDFERKLDKYNVEYRKKKDPEGKYVCGTVRCVGGWANFLTYGNALGLKGRTEWSARCALGLTYAEAQWLFYGTIGNTKAEELERIKKAAGEIAARVWETL